MKIRAVLIPADGWARLEGVHEALDCSAALVSVGEGHPTHLLVRGDPVPAPLVVSASFVATDLEDDEANCTLRIQGLPPLVLHTSAFRPLRVMLAPRWAESPERSTPSEPHRWTVRLVPSSGARPISAVIAPIAAVEEHFPQGVRFSKGSEEAILIGPGLGGIPGEAFHAIDLDPEATLYVPVGRDVDPPFARSCLGRVLSAKKGHAYFWRTSILEIAPGDLAPLTWREWHAR